MNKRCKHGFTLVELLIGITIITILSTIGFVAFIGNIGESRDQVRLDNLAKIELYLSDYKEKKGSYPLPTEGFNILNNGRVVAIQGKFNQKNIIDSFDVVPVDPKTKLPYHYSVNANRTAYQIGTTLEGDKMSKSIIMGNYNSVSVNTLPSIMLALKPDVGIDVEINQLLTEGLSNSTAFVFNNSTNNLLYDFNESGPLNSGIQLVDLISIAENNGYWQNHDYKDCQEIKDGGSYIGDGEYQILSNNNLINIECTIDGDG